MLQMAEIPALRSRLAAATALLSFDENVEVVSAATHPQTLEIAVFGTTAALKYAPLSTLGTKHPCVAHCMSSFSFPCTKHSVALLPPWHSLSLRCSQLGFIKPML